MPYSAMEKYISSQVKYWQQQHEMVDVSEKELKPKKQVLPFITLSREYGCSGFEIAEKIVDFLNKKQKQDPVWAAYDRKLLENIMKDMGLSLSLLHTLTSNARNALTNLLQTSFSTFPPQIAVYRKLAETIRLLAVNGNVVILGRAGNVITRDMKRGYHVRIVAHDEWKIENLKTKFGLKRKEAETLIRDKTMQREGFLREFVKFDPSDPHNYHLVVNCANHSIEEIAHIISEGMISKGFLSV